MASDLRTEPLRTGRILLVDDDENFISLMIACLTLHGYRVMTAENGQRAIETLQQIKPDLIISDIMMPKMNGYELVDAIRQTPDLSWIPVIFLSAKDQISDRVRGLSSGANVYMVKPFGIDELVAQIESTLRSSYLIQQNQLKRMEPTIQVPGSVKLTNAELLVAQLVAQGLSNLEIAQKLNASKRTIESHMSHMLKKTMLSNRTELSRWVIEKGMA
jgi:DNA-binding NarL/FixJ family response regulator